MFHYFSHKNFGFIQLLLFSNCLASWMQLQFSWIFSMDHLLLKFPPCEHPICFQKKLRDICKLTWLSTKNCKENTEWSLFNTPKPLKHEIPATPSFRKSFQQWILEGKILAGFPFSWQCLENRRKYKQKLHQIFSLGIRFFNLFLFFFMWGSRRAKRGCTGSLISRIYPGGSCSTWDTLYRGMGRSKKKKT